MRLSRSPIRCGARFRCDRTDMLRHNAGNDREGIGKWPRMWRVKKKVRLLLQVLDPVERDIDAVLATVGYAVRPPLKWLPILCAHVMSANCANNPTQQRLVTR